MLRLRDAMLAMFLFFLVNNLVALIKKMTETKYINVYHHLLIWAWAHDNISYTSYSLFVFHSALLNYLHWCFSLFFIYAYRTHLFVGPCMIYKKDEIRRIFGNMCSSIRSFKIP